MYFRLCGWRHVFIYWRNSLESNTTCTFRSVRQMAPPVGSHTIFLSLLSFTPCPCRMRRDCSALTASSSRSLPVDYTSTHGCCLPTSVDVQVRLVASVVAAHRLQQRQYRDDTQLLYVAVRSMSSGSLRPISSCVDHFSRSVVRGEQPARQSRQDWRDLIWHQSPAGENVYIWRRWRGWICGALPRAHQTARSHFRCLLDHGSPRHCTDCVTFDHCWHLKRLRW